MVIRLDPDAAGPNITFVEVLLIIELKRRVRRLSSLEAAAFWSERAVHTIHKHNVYFCTSVRISPAGFWIVSRSRGRRPPNEILFSKVVEKSPPLFVAWRPLSPVHVSCRPRRPRVAVGRRLQYNRMSSLRRRRRLSARLRSRSRSLASQLLKWRTFLRPQPDIDMSIN